MPDYLKKSLPSFVMFFIGLVIYFIIPSQVKVMPGEGALNARTLPYFSTLLIMGGSLIYSLISFVQGIKKTKNQNDEAEPAAEAAVNPALKAEKRMGYVRVGIMCLLIALWIALLEPVGYLIMTAIVSAGLMVTLGNKKPLQIIIVSVVLSGLTYYVFKILLYVSLPAGLFFV